MHDTFALRRFPGVRRAAAVAAAVLGLGVAALVAPGASQAGVCSPGEFCMWWGYSFNGGLYHHAGSDSNLWNDRFENANRNEVVADNTNSFWNRGTSSGPAQVRVFTGINGTGAHTCAPQGAKGHFRYDPATGIDWLNNVESFEWRSSC
jgi:hypothetical protein